MGEVRSKRQTAVSDRSEHDDDDLEVGGIEQSKQVKPILKYEPSATSDIDDAGQLGQSSGGGHPFEQGQTLTF